MAALVAEGLSNQQVARRMFLSGTRSTSTFATSSASSASTLAWRSPRGSALSCEGVPS